MKKILSIMMLILFSSTQVAIADDALGGLIIVDESSESTTLKQGEIVGCSDFSTKKEMNCSKEPEDIILNKLPTSKQIQEVNLEGKNSKKTDIQKQLETILAELNKLKKEQEEDRETIKELKETISIISNKKKTSVEKKKIVTDNIEKLKKRINPKTVVTRIKQPIKELYRTENSVVIEVQNNESLSTYAQFYYQDNTKYYKIYKANRDKITKNLQIVVGTELTIPLD